MINNQFIGQLKGLKLELDLKIGALDTDVKSLKKAARQAISPEILKRIEQIKKTGLIDLKNDFKIYWNNFPIAILTPGKNYLKPEIKLIVDDMIDNDDQLKLIEYLNTWMNEKIGEDLKNLIDLKNIKETNTSIRALAYQLYENNGVVKRNDVINFIKFLNQDERKILRTLGVKFGRYHIFLHRLFKPNAVSLRVLLWKNFHQKYLTLEPPKFGLNFFEDKKNINPNFMLMCGFENFDKYYVRIDILERLFLKIMDLNKNKDIKLNSEMLNLLGCNRDVFTKLIQKMNYKTFTKDNDLYFRYFPNKKIKKQFISKKINKINNDNPFNILKKINFK
jgi:ATP-dependent RNA helicase SUPV3L1/SUV3